MLYQRKYLRYLFVMFAFLGIILMLTGIYQTVSAQENRDDNAFVGISTCLSEPFDYLGEEQRKGYELAIQRINEEGGVLGQEIEFEVRDTNVNPLKTMENALDFINEHEADLITGGLTSHVALAQSSIAKEEKVLFLAGLTHSAAITGFDHREADYGEQVANRYTFRWFLNAMMTQNALNPYLEEKFGAGNNYYYITADYEWGDSLEHAIQHATESAGSDTAGSIRTDLGQEDFSKEVETAQEADPDILVLVLTGTDLIHALRDLHETGFDDIPVVVPAIGERLLDPLSPEKTADIISTINWTWSLQDRYPGSEEFVDAYMQQYGEPPPVQAAIGWVNVHEWASAVERAGTFDTSAVIEELEGHTFKL